jgi:glycosyltransferase involved in cell wall biosynthesis
MDKLLSVCLITKNEEKNIANCLKSVKDVADEIIVVDTGSTDKTVEIAKEYGADVHFFKWIDDFSAARNESIKYATGDYILIIDADEILEKPNMLLAALKKARSVNVLIMTCYQVNTMDKYGDGVASQLAVVRLFANHHGIYFEGKVHEQLKHPTQKVYLFTTDIKLLHSGYDLSPEDKLKKCQRNLDILNEMIANKEDSDYVWYQKIKTLQIMEKFDEALEIYNSTNLDSFPEPLRCELIYNFANDFKNKKEPEKFVYYCEQALKIMPENVNTNLSLGAYYHEIGKYEMALPYLFNGEEAIKNPTEHSKLGEVKVVPLDVLYQTIGNCYFELKDYVKAMAYFDKGMKVNPTNLLLLIGVANIAYKNGQFEQAKKVLQFALAHNPTHTGINDFIIEIDNAIINNATINNNKQTNPYYVNNVVSANKTTLGNINVNNLLSLCMIVKNEEKMLAGCLESAKNIIDEIIIVDTGSTDRTIEIAKQYGAKIYYFEWTNDFSEARNESIKYSTSKWILYLDADERLTPTSQNEIRTLLKTSAEEVGAYYVTIESDHRQLDNSTEKHRGSYPRLFKNLGYPNIKFMGRVHEQISPSIISMNKITLPSDLVIEHLGYDLSEEAMNKKVERNYKLLLEHIKDEPTNGYAWFQLGQTLGHMDLYNEAEDATRFAIRCGDLKGPVLASATASLSQFCGRKKDFVEALYWAEETLKFMPNQLYGLSLKAHSLLYLDRKKEAEQVFLQALDYAKHTNKMPKVGFDIDISEKILLEGLAKSRE